MCVPNVCTCKSKVSHLVFFRCVYSSLFGFPFSYICMCVSVCCFGYEGLDSRESCHLSAKSRNNQQPQQEAAFSAAYSISPNPATSSTRARTQIHTHTVRLQTRKLVHTHTRTQKHTSEHPMTFHAYSHKQIDNSQESLKTSHAWAQ